VPHALLDEVRRTGWTAALLERLRREGLRVEYDEATGTLTTAGDLGLLGQIEPAALPSPLRGLARPPGFV
jgi:hypothetical protein